MGKDSTPRAGKFYKHFKGSLYEVVCVAEHHETADKFVVYKSCDTGRIYLRPLDEWNDTIERHRFKLEERNHE